MTITSIANRSRETAVIDDTLQQITNEQERAFRSLYFDEMYQRRLEVTEEAINTCSWILEHPTYLAWQQRGKSLLWIKGKPGAGKSTIMNYVVKHHQHSSKGLLAYHFISGRGTGIQKSCLGTYQSLLHQIVSQRPASSSSFVHTFESKCKLQGEYGKKWTWHQKEVKDILRNTLSQVPPGTYIELFVDALDESGDNEARLLLKYFQDMAENVGSNLKICVSSRHYPLTSIVHDLEIVVENHNFDDITTYIQSELRESIGSGVKAEEVEKEMIDRSSNVFQWVFLVLPRVLDLCQYDSTLEALLLAIRAFPTELGQLYQDLISNVTEKDRILLHQLLRWVCFAVRPLSLLELRHAMAIDSVTGPISTRALETSVDFKESNKGMKAWVINLSRGLLEVREASNEAEDLDRLERSTRTDSPTATECPTPAQSLTLDTSENSLLVASSSATESQLANWIVQPNHQSVQDFVRDWNLFRLDSTNNDTLGAANWSILKSCLRYLAAEEVVQPFMLGGVYNSGDQWFKDKENLLAKFPFFNYALYCWPAHAIQVRDSQSRDMLTELVRLSGWPSDRVLVADVIAFYRGIAQHTPPRTFPLLHLAAYFGLFRVVDTILCDPSSPDPDMRETGQAGATALMCAAYGGHKNIVQLLLRTGRVDADLCGGPYTPLICAARHGDEVMMKMLLQDGRADPDVRATDGNTALDNAITYRWEEAVALLLETGQVDVSMRDFGGNTPLHNAILPYQDVGETNNEIVRLLIERGGAKMDARTYRGRTPLHRAVRLDQNKIAKLLLENGGVTTVDMKDRCGKTPLHNAASKGNSALVLMLLESGANTDTRDISGRTPLMDAAAPDLDEEWIEVHGLATRHIATRRPECCRLLLQYGAEADARCSHGRTAIFFVIGCEPGAYFSGRQVDLEMSIELIKLLIAAGADLNHRDEHERTVLSYAREFRNVVRYNQRQMPGHLTLNFWSVKVAKIMASRAEAYKHAGTGIAMMIAPRMMAGEVTAGCMMNMKDQKSRVSHLGFEGVGRPIP